MQHNSLGINRAFHENHVGQVKGDIFLQEKKKTIHEAPHDCITLKSTICDLY